MNAEFKQVGAGFSIDKAIPSEVTENIVKVSQRRVY